MKVDPSAMPVGQIRPKSPRGVFRGVKPAESSIDLHDHGSVRVEASKLEDLEPGELHLDEQNALSLLFGKLQVCRGIERLAKNGDVAIEDLELAGVELGRQHDGDARLGDGLRHWRRTLNEPALGILALDRLCGSSLCRRSFRGILRAKSRRKIPFMRMLLKKSIFSVQRETCM